MIALIDGDILVYRFGFASEKDSEKVAKARLQEFLTELMLFDLPGVTDYEGYLTDSEPSNFRYGVAVTHSYKGNRKGAKPVHYAALREALVSDYGFHVVYGSEADDAIATEATRLRDDAIIVSIDKDFDQVPGWHYNFVQKRKYYVTEKEGMISFYSQLLTGDRVDNIVGLYGIGPKKASKLLVDAETPTDCFKAVVEAYKAAGEPYERVIENGKLLWLRRSSGEEWQPPVSLPYTLPSSTE